MVENRFFSRVDIDTIVMLSVNGDKLKGNVVDVSVSGILIDLDEEREFDYNIEYSLDLFIPNSTIVVKAKVKMIRQNGKHFGMQFVDLDLGTMFLINTFSNLKKIEVGKFYSLDKIADFFELDKSQIERHFPTEEISGEQLIEFMDNMYERMK